jgi:hypothetical protein
MQLAFSAQNRTEGSNATSGLSMSKAALRYD